MAESIGIKYSAWARYEAGGSLPGADILARICRVHACSADWLLGLRASATPREPPAVIASGKNAVAVGHNSTVSIGESPICAKCPYKKKLKKLESLLNKG